MLGSRALWTRRRPVSALGKLSERPLLIGSVEPDGGYYDPATALTSARPDNVSFYELSVCSSFCHGQHASHTRRAARCGAAESVTSHRFSPPAITIQATPNRRRPTFARYRRLEAMVWGAVTHVVKMRQHPLRRRSEEAGDRRR